MPTVPEALAVKAVPVSWAPRKRGVLVSGSVDPVPRLPGSVGRSVLPVRCSGSGTMPTPLNCTSCSPVASLPLIGQSALAGPVSVGVNLTVSLTLSPGAIVVPSDSEVVASKAPPIGGLDFVISTLVPPVFVTVKLLDSLEPIATCPYSTFSSLTSSAPGSPAAPERPIASLPALGSRPISPLNAPTSVGLKVTVTNTDSPGLSSAPGFGASSTPNGPSGSFTFSIVSGEPPTLRKMAVAEACSPTAVPSKGTTIGEASGFAAGVSPVPDNPKLAVFPALVVAVSFPPISPDPAGEKVIGTSIVCPVVSSAGSGTEGVPSVNCEELDASWESVSGSVAVSVSVFFAESPIVVVPNA